MSQEEFKIVKKCILLPIEEEWIPVAASPEWLGESMTLVEVNGELVVICSGPSICPLDEIPHFPCTHKLRITRSEIGDMIVQDHSETYIIRSNGDIEGSGVSWSSHVEWRGTIPIIIGSRAVMIGALRVELPYGLGLSTRRNNIIVHDNDVIIAYASNIYMIRASKLYRVTGLEGTRLITSEDGLECDDTFITWTNLYRAIVVISVREIEISTPETFNVINGRYAVGDSGAVYTLRGFKWIRTGGIPSTLLNHKIVTAGRDIFSVDDTLVHMIEDGKWKRVGYSNPLLTQSLSDIGTTPSGVIIGVGNASLYNMSLPRAPELRSEYELGAMWLCNSSIGLVVQSERHMDYWDQTDHYIVNDDGLERIRSDEYEPLCRRDSLRVDSGYLIDEDNILAFIGNNYSEAYRTDSLNKFLVVNEEGVMRIIILLE